MSHWPNELFAFWEQIFGPEDPDIPIGVFLGQETDHNRHLVLAERDADVLAGTCGIMTPRANPEFAGIGEVATRPDYRGRGIAGRLCQSSTRRIRLKTAVKRSSSVPKTPMRRASISA